VSLLAVTAIILCVAAAAFIAGWIFGDTHGCDKTNREWIEAKDVDWKRIMIIKEPKESA
jgi:hypothetical protein